MPTSNDASGSWAERVYFEHCQRIARGEVSDFDELCSMHRELADELRALRESHRRGLGALHGLAADLDGSRDDDQRLLDAERYEVLEEIARGGMGRILRVRDRQLGRDLALKVLKLPTDAAVRDPHDQRRSQRMLNEARVLGRLQHPAIVPVHDVLVRPDGTIGITMQLVEGMDLRDVFRMHREGDPDWNLARVLRVLLQVCEGMAHTHSRGVLHRDLKPGNVMVGAFGETYILDWGLAKVRADSWSTDPPLRLGSSDQPDGDVLASLTLSGEVVGTPAYMPPEQARGDLDQIDERSDVYGVGAMLYHLLYGDYPYKEESGSNTPSEILQAVVERSPTPLAKLAPGAAEELVAICEKAMARSPDERYAEMNDLASELRAFLENRVVRAHRTGAFAELRKWVARNSMLAAALVLVVIVMTASGFGLAWQERRAADELEEERRKLQAVVDFQARVLTVNPWEDGAGVTALELLERSTEGIAASYRDQPAIETQIRTATVESFQKLGAYESALRERRRLRTLLTRQYGSNDERVLRTALDEGISLQSAGRLAEAGDWFTDLYERLTERFGPTHSLTLAAAKGIAESTLRLGHLEEAVESAAATLAEASGVSGEEARVQRLHLIGVRANGLMMLQRYEEAEAAFREQLEGWSVLETDGGPHSTAARSGIATIMAMTDRHEQAAVELRAVLQLEETVQGRDHPGTLETLENLSIALSKGGQTDEAIALQEEVVRGRRTKLPADHPAIARATLNLSTWYANANRVQEAAEMLVPLYEHVRARGGPSDLGELALWVNLGNLHRLAGNPESAVAVGQEAVHHVALALPPNHPWNTDANENLALALVEVGRATEALPFQEEALAVCRSIHGEDHYETADAIAVLAYALNHAGRDVEAEELLLNALDTATEVTEQRLAQELDDLYASRERD